MTIYVIINFSPTFKWRLAKYNHQVVSVCTLGMLLGATALGYSAAAQADQTGGVITSGDAELLASIDADLSGNEGSAYAWAYPYSDFASASADLNATESITTGDVTAAKIDKMAEVAVGEVATFWSSLGLTFPVEENSAKS